MSQYSANKQARKNLKEHDTSEGRRRREEGALLLRRNKRIEQFSQKRRHNAFANDEETAHFSNVERRLSEIGPLLQALHSDLAEHNLPATTQLRKLLSIEEPPIQQVIDLGVVPRLVQFLTRHDCPELQFEAAWAITNIVSGSSGQTEMVVKHGAVQYLKDLLRSPNINVRDQAVWALGNIAGDSPKYRDFILDFGILKDILKIFQENNSALFRNATWAIANLCRGKPEPEWNQIAEALPLLNRLTLYEDDEVIADACWALSYITDGPSERVQEVLESGATNRLIELLTIPNHTIQTPALRTIGNIVSGDDHHTQIVLEHNALPAITALLNSSKKAIRKEACWAMSNITAGNQDQIEAIILSPNIIPTICAIINNSDNETKKEAIWVITNATSGGTPEQVQKLVNMQIIQPLCDALDHPDYKIINVALDGIENILKAGDDLYDEESNIFTDMIEEAGGLEKIDALQNHENVEVYEKAVDLLETYYFASDDTSTLPDINTEGNAFQFGSNISTNYDF